MNNLVDICQITSKNSNESLVVFRTDNNKQYYSLYNTNELNQLNSTHGNLFKTTLFNTEATYIRTDIRAARIWWNGLIKQDYQFISNELAEQLAKKMNEVPE